jgi:hypothetical protein
MIVNLDSGGSSSEAEEAHCSVMVEGSPVVPNRTGFLQRAISKPLRPRQRARSQDLPAAVPPIRSQQPVVQSDFLAIADAHSKSDSHNRAKTRSCRASEGSPTPVWLSRADSVSTRITPRRAGNSSLVAKWRACPFGSDRTSGSLLRRYSRTWAFDGQISAMGVLVNLTGNSPLPNCESADANRSTVLVPISEAAQQIE